MEHPHPALRDEAVAKTNAPSRPFGAGRQETPIIRPPAVVRGQAWKAQHDMTTTVPEECRKMSEQIGRW
ncbi:hypothetical protein [Geminicoccus harenae]|uniref:hypothetical protein n=1 Tax=Geminicoccus harenae TaxID=2498453 RepID=UPI00168A735B|nr:hypothetical protein [Geminicoccus harenae]